MPYRNVDGEDNEAQETSKHLIDDNSRFQLPKNGQFKNLASSIGILNS